MSISHSLTLSFSLCFTLSPPHCLTLSVSHTLSLAHTLSLSLDLGGFRRRDQARNFGRRVLVNVNLVPDDQLHESGPLVTP